MWEMPLDRTGEIGLSRQIFRVLSGRILSGQLSQGESLPSTRELARELGVSRNTVNEAYAMLLAEGFVDSRQGAPTRVSAGLGPALSLGHKPDPAARGRPEAAVQGPDIRYDFRTGRPDLALFPWAAWSRIVSAAAVGLSTDQLGYGGLEGYAPLRAEISAWLLRSRGIEVDPADVFITAGATQALNLLADILYRDGLSFSLESPSHPGVQAILMKRYPVRWIPVDAFGMQTDRLTGQDTAAVFATPSHQYPLGGILPAGRRAALVRLARTHGFYLVEDDYDSEFRYSGAPVTPLYSMDPTRVVYVGTFSKTVYPALRLGFVILPEALQAEWRRRRRLLDVQSPILEQAALAEFLRTRQMDRHVRRMRRAYGEKRQLLLDAQESVFGSAVRTWGDASGLHLVLQFPGRDFGGSFVRDAAAAGIRILPLKAYCPGGDGHGDMLLLGYGHLEPAAIAEAIAALAHFLNEWKGDTHGLQQDG